MQIKNMTKKKNFWRLEKISILTIFIAGENKCLIVTYPDFCMPF